MASRLRDRSRVDPFVFSPVVVSSLGARSVSDRVSVLPRPLGVACSGFSFVPGVRSFEGEAPVARP